MQNLNDYVGDIAARTHGRDVAVTVDKLASAAILLHQAIRSGDVPIFAETAATSNASGETQKPLDIFADETFIAAAKEAPVAVYCSEEQETSVATGGGSLCLAIDPLDGSSNIETNIAVGTIFSISRVENTTRTPLTQTSTGAGQLAAGFFMYGAQLLLVLTAGEGTHVFIHNPETNVFHHQSRCHIPSSAREYSINGANRRHWSEGIRSYIADLEQGADGPRQQDFGMRYAGSLVADCYRILQRGGIFIYPGDKRPGYEGGRLRQHYEANPIAFCIEQAGGAATDTRQRLLSLPLGELHARVPLAFGARAEIAALGSYFETPAST